jgi:uncharacterized protein YfaS (alpha-2-macroglobulin family)
MAVKERGDWGKGKGTAQKIALAIAFFIVLFSPVEAADIEGIYPYNGSVTSLYNGTDSGYIMTYKWNDASPATSLRVALSTNRPDYVITDSVGVRIRTDGYYSRDCGWWYTVPGSDATINSLNISDPAGNLLRQYTSASAKIDDTGVWEDRVALRLNTSMPPGWYKVAADVSGAGQQISVENLTVYFKVLGLLNVTFDVNKTINRYENVTINVTVLSMNGSPVQGADVRAQIERRF